MHAILRALALMFLLCLAVRPGAAADDAALPAIAGASEARRHADDGVLPRALSLRDAALYRELFALTDRGLWDEVDALLPALGSDLLIGHLLAQRYLHPSAAAVPPEELALWLTRYGDHPQSGRIRALIEEKREAERRAVLAARRAAERERLARSRATSAAAAGKTRATRPAAGQERARGKRRGDSADAGFDPGRAVAALNAAAAPTAGGGHPFARPPGGERSAVLPASWDDGEPPLPGNWPGSWPGSWKDGLEAWQAGDYALAARHFATLAERRADRPWTVSAAAFWAARAHLYARQPERVTGLLLIAAEHPRTFYGLLARRILGMPMPFRWQPDEADRAAVAEFADTRAGRRALALIQIGRLALSEAELQQACCGRRGAHIHGAMVVAEQAGLARLAVRLSETLYPQGGGLDAAAYPVPHWRPDGGFTVNPALVYALARQESKFDPRAISPAGARGLMQVMPATANFVGRASGEWSPGAIALHDPTVNLAIGQRYIEMLLGEEHIGNDLFRLAAAWNGGPNNLRRWENGVAATDDPLLFIETIPYAETRDFIERVLANYWIYRHRFGQATPSLDALAAGAWPTLVEADDPLAPRGRSHEN